MRRSVEKERTIMTEKEAKTKGATDDPWEDLVVGLLSANAIGTLHASGFVVTQTRPLSCDADGTVTRQSPTGGQVVPQGSTVNITVPIPRVKPRCP